MARQDFPGRGHLSGDRLPTSGNQFPLLLGNRTLSCFRIPKQELGEELRERDRPVFCLLPFSCTPERWPPLSDLGPIDGFDSELGKGCIHVCVFKSLKNVHQNVKSHLCAGS